jgi:hypothetical protein
MTPFLYMNRDMSALEGRKSACENTRHLELVLSQSHRASCLICNDNEVWKDFKIRRLLVEKRVLHV